MKNSRRAFIRKSALAGSGLLVAKAGFTASSYNRIIGSNDRVRVGVSRIFRSPPFYPYALLHEPL